MRDVRARTRVGLFKVLHGIKVVVVAVVCLIFGFSARQLFDAYGKEMIPFLRKDKPQAEVRLNVTSHEYTPLRSEGWDPR